MKINVIDKSETVVPEISWGKDLNTGKWSVDIYFDGIPETDDYEEDL